MPNPTTPEPSPGGPSEVPHDWRPEIPQPRREAPREELPAAWQAQEAARRTGQPLQPGLPAHDDRPVPMRQETQTLGTLMGDVVRTGAWTAASRTTTVLLFGDVKLDLREVIRPGETLEVSTFTAAGDVRIVVPPGTRVELSGFTALGSSRHDVDPEVAAAPETGARVLLTASTLMGDVRVRTMPLAIEGKPPRGWRWVTKR